MATQEVSFRLFVIALVLRGMDQWRYLTSKPGSRNGTAVGNFPYFRFWVSRMAERRSDICTPFSCAKFTLDCTQLTSFLRSDSSSFRVECLARSVGVAYS